MSKKKYWQSFGELNNTEKHKERVFVKEFKDKDTTPVAELSVEALESAGTSRRDFLKYLGFASITAGIVSSCETAVKKAVPFLNKPDNIVPGEASFYATTFSLDGEVIPVLAKVRDGRPIKIEGNDLSTIYQGATTAKVHASVLGLYDTARLRHPLKKVSDSYKQMSIEEIDSELKTKIDNQNIVLVTNSIPSPSTRNIVEEFTKKHKVTHIQYDEISYSGILDANEKSFSKRAIPAYQFQNAEVVVGIGADFLGTWITPAAFSKQWSKQRKVSARSLKMSKHVQVESILTLTGANADERVIIKPSEEALFVAYLYQQLSGKTNVIVSLDEKTKSKANEIIKVLQANKSKSLVVCGSNDVNVQITVNAINQILESYNHTIDWTTTISTRNGSDEKIKNLVADIQAKKYSVVIFAGGANPVYSYHLGEDLKKAITQNIPTSISLNTHLDETSQVCNYIIPDNHALESWGDFQIQSGHYSFAQPCINPLFKTRAWQETLNHLSGNTNTLEQTIKQYWSKKLGSYGAFEKALQDGVFVDEKEKTKANFSDAATSQAYNKISAQTKNTSDEIIFYQKIAIGSGAMANNPWLQEMPDPISKATWDNYAMISPAMAKKLNIVVDDNYEVEVDKPIINLTINNQSLTLPVLVIPGVHANVIGVAIGYGRTDKIGKAVQGVGKNVYHFVRNNGTNVEYATNVSKVENSGEVYPIAYTQTHNSYEGREEVMREFTLQTFASNPQVIINEREAEFKKYKNNVTDEQQYKANATLYAQHDNPGIKWGMSIDLNSCTGCGSCVVACNAENNISVVGKKQVLKAHEMHWMRIDRYFSGDVENPDVVFQPMLCQHCDNAPCENVCPVAATNHSSEGLNHMTYNRCIGTRYCANNCPFKVRRFNWLDFNGADSFKDNQQPLIDEGALDEVVMDMNADLTRLVLNPDVTVRSRGVIEKCSFCVQRLQGGKIKAKKENRPLADADVKTACMQACPTDAIVFGNVNNKESQISKLRNSEQKERVFYVLETIHVLPNVNYLAKVRNKNSEQKSTQTIAQHH